jgi:hypothetical protein
MQTLKTPTVRVCLHAKTGNATCPCGAALTGTARQKFCSAKCRIKAYRALQKAAKAARRLYRYREFNGARALGVLAYGGPTNTSVPCVGQLDLKPFIAKVVERQKEAVL